jgi:hypothetical protein
MKFRIKQSHGKKVEEGVGAREVLAVPPGGHQQHQLIHHILPNNSIYSWVFRYIFRCGIAKVGCGVAKVGSCVAKVGCGATN